MSAILPEIPRTYEGVPASSALIPRSGSQPHLEDRPVRGTRRDRIESLIIFAIVTVGAFLLGYHVLSTNHVVVFSALDHLTRAYMVLWDAPPKLAAIGFASPPVPTLLLVPFIVIKPLASSLISLPLFSAMFFGGTVMMLGRLLRTCEFPFVARIAVLLAFALNPMWLFYGTNGNPDMVYLFFLAGGLYSFISWYRGHATIHLIAAGVAFSLCMLSRYGLIPMAALLSLMIGAALYRRGADRDEVEGSVIGFMAPCVYAFALWALINAAIIGSPLGWLGNAPSTISVNSAPATAHVYSLSQVASQMFTVVGDAGPLALLAVPLLIVAFLLRRDTLSLWLAGLMALTVLLTGSGAVTAGQVSRVVLSNGLSVELVAVVALAYVYSVATTLRLPVLAGMLAVLVLAIPLAWNGMLKYPYQNMEQAFVHALQHPSQNLTGQGSRGGYTDIGVQSEQQMASYIKQTLGHRQHQILVDNANSYGVIILTGRPQVFVDRSQRGDGPWKQKLDNPFGHVGYMLIAHSAGDLIHLRYPNAIAGGNPDLKVVYTTKRYTLVKVVAAPPGQLAATLRSARRVTK
jgi:hypothetical protein